MQVIRYSYLPDIFIDHSGKIIDYIFRPKIPLQLSYKDYLPEFLVDCLLDSGSDINLFPSVWGEAIGITVTKGKGASMVGIGDSKVYAYYHKITLHLGSFAFETDAYFSEQQDQPLLGRKGFFNCFKRVTFHEGERIIELEPKP